MFLRLGFTFHALFFLWESTTSAALLIFLICTKCIRGNKRNVANNSSAHLHTHNANENECGCVRVWEKRVRACRKRCFTLSGLFVLCGLHSLTLHTYTKKINKNTYIYICIYVHAPVCACMRFLPQLRPGLHGPRTHHKQLQRR